VDSCCAYALSSQRALLLWPPHWRGARVPCPTGCRSSRHRRRRPPCSSNPIPPGADVRTAQGQTCLTPCSLTVPPENHRCRSPRTATCRRRSRSRRMPEHSCSKTRRRTFNQSGGRGAAAGPATAQAGAQAEAASDGREGRCAAAPQQQQPAVDRRSHRRHRRGASASADCVSRSWAISGARCPGPSGLYPAQLLTI